MHLGNLFVSQGKLLSETKLNKGKQMKTMDTTVGYVTTLEKATETATQWHRPDLGYHTQVVTKDGGYICRVVING